MTTIENEFLKISTNQQGGELTEIFGKKNNLHYLHNGDPKYWGRHSPVLFPIVGRLKDDTYSYDGKKYHLTQHGFARDLDFQLVSESANALTYYLTDTKETKEKYPFSFELFISYELIDSSVKVTYEVKNPAEQTMYFSLGAHPAFVLPLEKGLEFSDYDLTFSKLPEEKLALDGPFLALEKSTKSAEKISLDYELFKNDALIFKTSGKEILTVKSDKGSHGLTFSYEDFPFLGIWTPYGKNAPFLCLEPWCGIADTTDATGDLKRKFGINQLKGQETFKRSYTMTFF